MKGASQNASSLTLAPRFVESKTENWTLPIVFSKGLIYYYQPLGGCGPGLCNLYTDFSTLNGFALYWKPLPVLCRAQRLYITLVLDRILLVFQQCPYVCSVMCVQTTGFLHRGTLTALSYKFCQPLFSAYNMEVMSREPFFCS